MQANRKIRVWKSKNVWSANDNIRLTAMLGLLDADITEFLAPDPNNPGELTDISDTTDPLVSPDLTDKKYLQAGYDFGDAINYISQLGFYGAPRTWSISATYTY